ncbi:MAG: hypothetical protein PVG07_09140 [Acidobacteriota bacterium]|jgi:tetratricopeptide (TPR) repeat protein
MRAIESHATPEDLRLLARGGIADPERAGASAEGLGSARGMDRVREHLRSGCPRCASDLRHATVREAPSLRRLIAETFLTSEEPATGVISELAGRATAWATLLEAERATAPELEEILLAMPPGERPETIRTGARFHSLGLVHHLMARARDEGFRDPSRAACLAELAVEAAESLQEGTYPVSFSAEARALAWATLGNALRVTSDLFGAERAFRSAEAHLAAEAEHPVARAEVLSLLGSLRLSQARYVEAMTVLSVAVEIYRTFGERRQEGKVLMKMAKAAGEAGEADQAVALLERAETLLDPAADRKLLLYARHGRAAWLRDAGRSREAAELFEELRPEYEAELGDFFSQQRFDWVGARIAWSSGELERAERELKQVRGAFEEREEAYDFALVSLDLATLYLEQGRTAEVRRLAEEMLPIFTSRRIHHHALAALVLFQRAAEAETATVDFVRDLATFLHRARHNPYLAYEPAP